MHAAMDLNRSTPLRHNSLHRRYMRKLAANADRRKAVRNATTSLSWRSGRFKVAIAIAYSNQPLACMGQKDSLNPELPGIGTFNSSADQP
jgi:hypothetical protein